MRYLTLLVLLASGLTAAAEPLRVAVAANFRPTLERLSAAFTRETGRPVAITAAATGVLYTQILQGAPFDLLLAADRESVVRLHEAGRAGRPFCYARGSLVLAGDDGRLAQLADPNHSVAIANPATAPYGTAALEVLARPEFAPGNARRLVRGANIMQAYQFWHSGAVDLALLPRALAADATPVPQDWHRPIEQWGAALVAPAQRPGLNAYLEWLGSDTVRSLITDAGYAPCP